VGASISTHDFRERVPALLEAGVDCLVVDSSDGHSEWQVETCQWIRKTYGPSVVVGGGNVVTREGFRCLVEEGDVDFVKIGIGGGSICITREQKGIGRGQASAVIEVAAERDAYAREKGVYIPICSDGAINTDTNMIMALALGADFLMMGKYFAGCEESPTETITYRGRLYKPYWGEGSNRARNWQRYKQSERPELIFEEGVDAYVPFSGRLSEKVESSLAKIRSSMCNCGVLTVRELHTNARVTRVSELTIIEGGTSSVERLDQVNGGRG
jgi:IMP dehydrogenase